MLTEAFIHLTINCVEMSQIIFRSLCSEMNQTFTGQVAPFGSWVVRVCTATLSPVACRGTECSWPDIPRQARPFMNQVGRFRGVVKILVFDRRNCDFSHIITSKK